MTPSRPVVRPKTFKVLYMRPLASCVAAAGVAILGTACGGGSTASPTSVSAPDELPAPAPGPRLVIVSIDGLRPDALSAGGASTLLGLASRGTFTWSARTVNPSTTVPSHVSMLTGYPPSFHRITWDDWRPEKGYCPLPTVLQLARASGLRTSLVVGKEKLKILAIPGSAQFFFAGSTEAVANQAVTEILGGVDVLFVHFPEVDLTGHSLGWMSPSYLGAVGETDRALGRIVDALGERSTIIVTADHGGNGRDHGAGMTQDMLIPWVVVGPGVPRGRAVTRTIRTMDTAATAAAILGLTLAPDAEGRVVTEVFAPAGSGTGITYAGGPSRAATGLFIRPEKSAEMLRQEGR